MWCPNSLKFIAAVIVDVFHRLVGRCVCRFFIDKVLGVVYCFGVLSIVVWIGNIFELTLIFINIFAKM